MLLFPDPCAQSLFVSCILTYVHTLCYLLFPFPTPWPLYGTCCRRSLRLSSGLASLQLVQIPAANRHVALVLIHAPCKALDVLRTGARLLLGGSTPISSLCVVQAVVHRLCIRVRCCWLLGLVLRWRGRAAAEQAADSVAD